MTIADQVVVASRGIVAGVLFTAALAKVRDRQGTRAALAASGLPVGLDLTLPVVEAFTALGLVVERHTAWAAYVACALLSAFTVFIFVEVRRGITTPCPCFGAAASSPPAGARTIVRNLVLLALAVMATGTAPRVQWVAWLWAVSVVVGGVIAARRQP